MHWRKIKQSKEVRKHYRIFLRYFMITKTILKGFFYIFSFLFDYYCFLDIFSCPRKWLWFGAHTLTKLIADIFINYQAYNVFPSHTLIKDPPGSMWFASDPHPTPVWPTIPLHRYPRTLSSWLLLQHPKHSNSSGTCPGCLLLWGCFGYIYAPRIWK